MTHSPSLVLIQKLESHCARCVQPFRINGRLHMAIAQFAKDVGGEMPGMHAGDSDVPVLLYRWEQGAFVYEGEVPATGGEDAEYFEISGRRFLAVANIRSGSRPYEHDVTSMIYEHRDGNWYSFQVVASFGAKQWRHFVIEGEHFLGLAQGIQVPELSTQHPSTSRIYRWNGCSFVEFQVIDGHWGYNWSHVKHAGRHFLAYADHTSFSPVFEWKDGRFQPWLKMAEKGGRAFCFFEESGSLLGVFASISGRTLLGTFSDQGFHCIQELGGTGGRELALLEHDGQRYLARVCFITGGRDSPETVQTSELFRWVEGRFHKISEFTTHGGTSAAWFVESGQPYLIVANSLSPDVRFLNDCQVYRLDI